MALSITKQKVGTQQKGHFAEHHSTNSFVLLSAIVMSVIVLSVIMRVFCSEISAQNGQNPFHGATTLGAMALSLKTFSITIYKGDTMNKNSCIVQLSPDRYDAL
jgi:hypothetical protein